MPQHVGKKLPDLTRSKTPWGTPHNPDMSAGTVVKREKTGQDFTRNADPGGDDKAFPTKSGGLQSPTLPGAEDFSLIKEF